MTEFFLNPIGMMVLAAVGGLVVYSIIRWASSDDHHDHTGRTA
jgi:hypothetical protein